MLTSVFVVAIGGAIGSVLRYFLVTGIQHWVHSSFPWGTFAVNVVGCALTGILAAKILATDGFRYEYILLLKIGLLGGFTTFSSFAWEGLWLIKNGQVAMAASYILLSNIFGISAAWIGYIFMSR